MGNAKKYKAKLLSFGLLAGFVSLLVYDRYLDNLTAREERLLRERGFIVGNEDLLNFYPRDEENAAQHYQVVID